MIDQVPASVAKTYLLLPSSELVFCDISTWPLCSFSFPRLDLLKVGNSIVYSLGVRTFQVLSLVPIFQALHL